MVAVVIFTSDYKYARQGGQAAAQSGPQPRGAQKRAPRPRRGTCSTPAPAFCRSLDQPEPEYQARLIAPIRRLLSTATRSGFTQRSRHHHQNRTATAYRERAGGEYGAIPGKSSKSRIRSVAYVNHFFHKGLDGFSPLWGRVSR